MIGPSKSLLVVVLMGVACTVLLLSGCRPAESESVGDATDSQATQVGKLRVVAGIPPLAYLVRRIAGEHADVGVLVQPGQDPHVFEPTPRQVLALSRAQLLFKIGMPFESELIERLQQSGRQIPVVDATAGIRRRTMVEEELDSPTTHDAAEQGHSEDGHSEASHSEASHSDDGHEEAGHSEDGHKDAEHEHGKHDHAGEPDPHVWLAPQALRSMAGQITEALARTDPAHRAEYEQNGATLSAELDALDARIGRALAPYRGQSFYVFHPAFGYFADAYGLKQKSVEMEGKSPSPRRLRTLVAQARAEGVKLIFAQPQFDSRSAQVVADSIGGVVMLMDPMAENVIANLADVAKKVEGSLSK